MRFIYQLPLASGLLNQLPCEIEQTPLEAIDKAKELSIYLGTLVVVRYEQSEYCKNWVLASYNKGEKASRLRKVLQGDTEAPSNILRIPQSSSDETTLQLGCKVVECLLEALGVPKENQEIQYYITGQLEGAPCIEVCIY